MLSNVYISSSYSRCKEHNHNKFYTRRKVWPASTPLHQALAHIRYFVAIGRTAFRAYHMSRGPVSFCYTEKLSRRPSIVGKTHNGPTDESPIPALNRVLLAGYKKWAWTLPAPADCWLEVKHRAQKKIYEYIPAPKWLPEKDKPCYPHEIKEVYKTCLCWISAKRSDVILHKIHRQSFILETHIQVFGRNRGARQLWCLKSMGYLTVTSYQTHESESIKSVVSRWINLNSNFMEVR